MFLYSEDLDLLRHEICVLQGLCHLKRPTCKKNASIKKIEKNKIAASLAALHVYLIYKKIRTIKNLLVLWALLRLSSQVCACACPVCLRVHACVDIVV